MLDYGAGSGVLAIPVARSVPEGTVYAVDESPEMLEHPRLIRANHLDLADHNVDRVLAVNLLYEVVGKAALEEMRRVLRPDGFLLVVDWRSDVEREEGPPAEVSLTPRTGREMLEEVGSDVAAVENIRFPYHFVYLAREPAEDRS